jgi:hypothetical protein
VNLLPQARFAGAAPCALPDWAYRSSDSTECPKVVQRAVPYTKSMDQLKKIALTEPTSHKFPMLSTSLTFHLLVVAKRSCSLFAPRGIIPAGVEY